MGHVVLSKNTRDHSCLKQRLGRTRPEEVLVRLHGNRHQLSIARQVEDLLAVGAPNRVPTSCPRDLPFPTPLRRYRLNKHLRVDDGIRKQEPPAIRRKRRINRSRITDTLTVLCSWEQRDNPSCPRGDLTGNDPVLIGRDVRGKHATEWHWDNRSDGRSLSQQCLLTCAAHRPLHDPALIPAERGINDPPAVP